MTRVPEAMEEDYGGRVSGTWADDDAHPWLDRGLPGQNDRRDDRCLHRDPIR